MTATGLRAANAITLNDGRSMPLLGLGLMRFGGEDETAAVMRRGYDVGYRLFDTAAVYGNEQQTGDGIHALPAGGADIFLTTKLWPNSYGMEKARPALERSLARLRVEAVDLYLIHWPMPEMDLYVETWQALIAMREAGLARSIGVSNFNPDHIERIIAETGVAPAVNQVEMHPYFQQAELRKCHAKHGIVTQAWSPFGGGGRGNAGALLDDPVLVSIAEKHGKSAGQVVLRWLVQQDISVIPKATSEKHLRQNFEIFDFALDEADLAAIAGLDRADGRLGPDPATLNKIALEAD